MEKKTLAIFPQSFCFWGGRIWSHTSGQIYYTQIGLEKEKERTRGSRSVRFESLINIGSMNLVDLQGEKIG